MIDNATNLVELQREASQAELDAGKTAAQRNRLGQFATPNALAVDIARYVQSILGEAQGGIRFADPSVGSGSFFSAALTVFGSKRMTSAVGVELDPAFVDVARSLWGSAGLEVVFGDFTQIIADRACPPARGRHGIGVRLLFRGARVRSHGVELPGCTVLRCRRLPPPSRSQHLGREPRRASHGR